MTVDHELERRVQAGARDVFGGCAPVSIEPMRGGHSGLTWTADLETAQGVVRVVVKSTPPGRRPIGRHDVLRQGRVMRALHESGEVVVPKVYFEDAGEPPFFAMGRVEGEGAEPVLDRDHELPSPATVAALWDQAVVLLTRLHARDPGQLTPVRAEAASTPAEEVARWTRTMAAGGRADDPGAVALGARLAASAPPLERPALLHGDYRLGNMLYSDARVRAVIDWEIWSVGDPRCDLGWLVLFCDDGNFADLGRPVAGAPSAESVIARYEQLVERPLRRPHWFRALACFKLAAVQAHNLVRHRAGRRHDPYLESFGPSVDRLIQVGLEQVGREHLPA